MIEIKNSPIPHLRAPAFLLAVFFSMHLLIPAANAEEEDPVIPERLRAVKEWAGVITVTNKDDYSFKTEISKGSTALFCKANYRVDLPYIGDEGLDEWGTDQEQPSPRKSVGHGSASVSGHEVGTMKELGTWRSTHTGNGEEEMIVSLQMYPVGYQISLEAKIPKKIHESFTSAMPQVIPSSSGTRDETTRCVAGDGMLPYPKTGYTLSGSKTYEEGAEPNDPQLNALREQLVQDMARQGFKGKTISTISWNLYPKEHPEFEAEVSIDQYETWLPEGNEDISKPGSRMTITVEVKAKKGARTKPEVEQYIFELKDTSKEPGVAMNWPEEGGNDWDFKFDAVMNPFFEIQNEGQRAESKEGSFEDKPAKIVLNSYDFGGRTTLVARAKMSDGNTIVAHLKGDEMKQHIPIPKREDSSKIADAWKKKTPGASGKGDEADDDNHPRGDKRPGDGLTMFQEYRGFMDSTKRKARHFRTTPKTKDVFVIDTIGSGASRAGIRLYEFNTELDAHVISVLDVKERVINFNASSSVNHVKQHAIKMKWDESLRGTSVGGAAAEVATPKNGGELTINPFLQGFVSMGGHERADAARIIAHELLHTSCVSHHGESDIGAVQWKTWTDPAAQKPVILEKTLDDDGQPSGAARRVRVFYEDGVEAEAVLFSRALPLYVAVQGGQHSGVQECMMRYNVANAYDPKKRSSKRVWIQGDPEEAGMIICDKKGTNRRCGPAAMGNCSRQICINDRYTTCVKA